eukprot:TRINITY_DN886_c0_g2_i3.p1 TRINITY_DN886_c0_g2~~TRINITY_DN886_c0_g2_i3.p1  ORF type:complete len:250 (+),score=-20.01 TRINITY_DN886_c0_g2_i3:505-1254(+)
MTFKYKRLLKVIIIIICIEMIKIKSKLDFQIICVTSLKFCLKKNNIYQNQLNCRNFKFNFRILLQISLHSETLHIQKLQQILQLLLLRFFKVILNQLVMILFLNIQLQGIFIIIISNNFNFLCNLLKHIYRKKYFCINCLEKKSRSNYQQFSQPIGQNFLYKFHPDTTVKNNVNIPTIVQPKKKNNTHNIAQEKLTILINTHKNKPTNVPTTFDLLNIQQRKKHYTRNYKNFPNQHQLPNYCLNFKTLK